MSNCAALGTDLKRSCGRDHWTHFTEKGCFLLVLNAGNEGMIHFIVIDDNPSNPHSHPFPAWSAPVRFFKEILVEFSWYQIFGAINEILLRITQSRYSHPPITGWWFGTCFILTIQNIPKQVNYPVVRRIPLAIPGRHHEVFKLAAVNRELRLIPSTMFPRRRCSGASTMPTGGRPLQKGIYPGYSCLLDREHMVNWVKTLMS